MRVERSPRSNRYCGPAALSLLTGQHVDHVTRVTREQVRHGRAVRGLPASDMLASLSALGHVALPVPILNGEDRKYGHAPTLVEALRRLEPRAAAARYLVLLTGHWVVLQGRKVYDNKHPEGIWLRQCPYRRRRVRAVFQVTPSPSFRRSIMTNDIRSKIYNRSQLWSNGNGRDYIKIGDEIFSINGLYCDQDGKQDRWGRHVTIMDVRWAVMLHRRYDGKLEYVGDARDIDALDHWGYTWPTMSQPKGDYQRVPWGEDRLAVVPPSQEAK